MNENGMNQPILTAPVQRTLADYVADQLRQAILANQLEPGQRLVEQDLAAQMQTSRGPVRDALKILENEGLVVRQSHRGATVAELTQEDVIEIYSVREALETLAIKFAIRSATQEQIDELAQIVQEMEGMTQHDYSQVDATDLDLRFHHTLCRISGHKRVLMVWEALSTQIRILVLRHRLFNPNDMRERGVVWHARIVEAMRRRDTEAAVRELRKHMAISTEGVIETPSENGAVPST